MTRFLMVRHGESEWKVARRYSGWADPQLTYSGAQATVRLARELAPVAFDGIVSSDLARARQTAAILAKELGLRILAVEPALRERDVGSWTELTKPEVDARWPGLRSAIRHGTAPGPPGGEATDVFRDRVVAAVGGLALRFPRSTLLGVTHGGAIRALERHLKLKRNPLENLGARWFKHDGVSLQPWIPTP